MKSLLKASPANPSIDAIFQAFDGRDCDIDGATCHVAVYGVHEDGQSKWVQLSIDGPEQRLVTLRISSAEPASIISKIN